MIDCSNAEIRDLLPDLAHGSLDASTREVVEAHVASCAPCAEELALLRTVRATLSTAPAIDATRIVRSLPEPPRAGRKALRPAGYGVTVLRAAAAALLVVGLGGVSLRRMTLDFSTAASPSSVPTAPRAGTVAPSAAEGGDREGGVAASLPTEGAPVGLSLAGGFADFSSADLDALAADLDDLDALVDSEPDGVLPTVEPTGGA